VFESKRDSEDRLKVLLVEDSLIDAHLIIAILDAEATYNVTLAQDGMKGTLLATEQEWDLVITDLNLPGDSGLAVIKQSKEHHPETPILTTTGYTEPKYIQSALRAGADEVLMKPVERQELLRKLLYLLGTGRAKTHKRVGRTVLAIGAHPGDVEAGCGGILLEHRNHNQRVVILTLAGVPIAAADQGAPETVSEKLGARLITHDDTVDYVHNGPEIAEIVADAVRAFQPDTIYVPSVHDQNENRINTHRAGLLGSGHVPNLYCYQTVSSTTDFRPTLFVGVEGVINSKIDLLSGYEGRSEVDPGFSPDQIRSTAQYWGRFDSYEAAEPLEVVRSEV